MDSDFNFTYFLFQVSQPTICGLNFELKSNLPHLTTKTRGAATVSSVARTKPKTSSSLVFLGACKHFSKTPQICHKPRVGTKKKIYNRSSVKIWVLHTIPASDNQEFFFSIQTNLVWLNVESPNSGSWRMQQKKENWFSWKMVYYELRPTTTREEAYKVTLIWFRIKPSLKVRSWGASILISITDERSRPIWNQFYMMSWVFQSSLKALPE